MFTKLKTILSPNSAEIKSWQICLSLAGLAYPFWSHLIHWSYPNEFNDSILTRWTLGVLCLILAISPLIIKNQKFRSFYGCIGFLSCIGVSSHYYYLTDLNNYHTLYAIGYFLVLSISISFFTNIIQSIIFAPFSLLIIISISKNQTFINPIIYFAWCATIMTSLYWVNFFKQKYFKSLLSSLQENLKLKENLKASSRYAALGEMASGIGHEINNPLMVLNTNLELIKLNPNLSNNKTILSMQRNIEKISDITKSLKNFQIYNSESKQDKISAILILNEVLPLVNPKADELSCPIDLVGEINRSFISNKKILSQIFFNIINNALDAVEPLNKKWIKISIEHKNNFIHIHFTDSGSGISAPSSENLFSPFFSTKPLGKGVGLGLSSCKQMALTLGGDLNYSTYKNHTRFTVSIPLN